MLEDKIYYFLGAIIGPQALAALRLLQAGIKGDYIFHSHAAQKRLAKYTLDPGAFPGPKPRPFFPEEGQIFFGQKGIHYRQAIPGKAGAPRTIALIPPSPGKEPPGEQCLHLRLGQSALQCFPALLESFP